MSSRRMRLVVACALCAVTSLALAGVADAKKKPIKVKTTLAFSDATDTGVTGTMTVNKKKGQYCLSRTITIHVNGNPTQTQPRSKSDTVSEFRHFTSRGGWAGATIFADVPKSTIAKNTFPDQKRKIVCKAAKTETVNV